MSSARARFLLMLAVRTAGTAMVLFFRGVVVVFQVGQAREFAIDLM
jgi:hypothetical protein